jgi:inner membrane protein
VHVDNLTHALVGASLAKAGAERATPLATATLVVAANAPDVDMLAFARGEYFALAFRRGITHGLPAMVVLPFLVTGAMLAWDRWVRRRRNPDAEPARPGPLLALSAFGLLTHPALDWLNTYGMRWWLPFDGTWTYGDALFIIDPWVWLMLGGAVFLSSTPSRAGLWGWAVLGALTTALVVWGMGGLPAALWVVGLAAVVAWRVRRGPAGSGGRRRLARAAIGCTAAYIGFMIAAGLAARRQVAAAAQVEGLEVRDVLVAPSRGNPFVADVEVRTADAFVPGVHRWLGTPRVRLRPEDATPLLAAPDVEPATLDRILTAARAHRAVADYLVWSRHPYVRVTEAGDGWDVRFGDVRYDEQPKAGGLAGLSVHVPRSQVP